MIELLQGIKEELEKAACKIHGQNAKARLEVSPQRKPLGVQNRTFHGKHQISFYVEKDVAATNTREGEGHAEEGWIINLLVVSAMCTDFGEALKQW